MTLECINPDDLSVPRTYTHVVVASGSRLVFVAGQVAEDGQRNLVGAGDLPSRPAKRSQTSGGHSLQAVPGLTR